MSKTDQEEIIANIGRHFPAFAALLTSPNEDVFDLQPPASDNDIAADERMTSVSYPNSYRAFLQASRQVSASGFSVGLSSTFIHDSGESAGMLCFGDFFVLADGDQALFDLTNGLIEGEYPVSYYDHEGQVGKLVRPVARSFGEFIELFATNKLNLID